MTKVLLDIGARDTSFVKSFRRYNREHGFSFICGDINFDGKWNGFRKGITKIHARYDNFNVPDLSLDAVTINAFHPLACRGLRGFSDEINRTLKPGGVLFSAHPVGMHPYVELHPFIPAQFSGMDDLENEEMLCISFSPSGRIFSRWSIHLNLPNGMRVEYPASATIRDRIIYAGAQRTFGLPVSAQYIYRHTNKMPNLRVWIKQ